MSDYGSRLLLRRICAACKLRLSIQHEMGPGVSARPWTIHAIDDVGRRNWVVREDTLDHAARSLAAELGVPLPSDQLGRGESRAPRERGREGSRLMGWWRTDMD